MTTTERQRIAAQFHQAAITASQVAEAAEKTIGTISPHVQPIASADPNGLPPHAARLRQLRAAWPDWQFEYDANKVVPWNAQRRITPEWRGGHSTCDAQDPDTLEVLLRCAMDTQLLTRPHGRAGR